AAIGFRRRRSDEAGRLVDDDQVIVAMHDARREPAWFLRPLECAADVDLDHLARAHRTTCDLHARLVDEHAAEIDHRARLAARQPGDVFGNHLIETQTLVLGGDLERRLRAHVQLARATTSSTASASGSGTSSCKKWPALVRTIVASGRSRSR